MEALNVVKNIRHGSGTGMVASTVHTLALEHAKEAFAGGIVRTAIHRAHAAHHVATG